MTHHAQLITPVSLLLANCCKALGASAFGAATPPYKSLIYNALCSAGCFLARRGYCLLRKEFFRHKNKRTERKTCTYVLLSRNQINTNVWSFLDIRTKEQKGKHVLMFFCQETNYGLS